MITTTLILAATLMLNPEMALMNTDNDSNTPKSTSEVSDWDVSEVQSNPVDWDLSGPLTARPPSELLSPAYIGEWDVSEITERTEADLERLERARMIGEANRYLWNRFLGRFYSEQNGRVTQW